MAGHSAQRRATPDAEIPDRLYYRIGDVARILGVEPYVLRFWETQFPQLKPNKGGTGQRLYRRRDLDLALRIKKLVHEEGYTIAGARQTLESPGRPRSKQHHLDLSTGEQNDKGSTQAGQARASQTGLGQSRMSQARLGQARVDQARAAIGRIRSELREIAAQLALPEPSVARRRARVTTMPAAMLFPDSEG